MSQKYKSVSLRFMKAFLTGVTTSIGLITFADVKTWGDLHTALNAISLTIIIGGLNGLIMAMEKAINWTE